MIAHRSAAVKSAAVDRWSGRLQTGAAYWPDAGGGSGRIRLAISSSE